MVSTLYRLLSKKMGMAVSLVILKGRSMKMPEGFKRLSSNTSPYDLLVKDKYKALVLIKVLAKALERHKCNASTMGFKGSEVTHSCTKCAALNKLEEWE